MTDLPAGSTCLDASECALDHYCGWQCVCAPVCSASQPCASGSACFPQSAGSLGYCYAGDGCDLVAQDCDNGAACIWLGNAATLCWYASAATAGQPCVEGACAPGHQCSFITDRCEALCDASQSGGCPAGESCIDQSAQAGMPIGVCG